MDIFFPYERGSEILLERLGKDHQRYDEVLTLQSRLLENIARARRYGDTEVRRAERAEIVEALNNLALKTVGESLARIGGGEDMDSCGSQQLASRAHEVSERLRSAKKYLRGARGFPPKQVVDDLFLVMEQTAQFTEEVRGNPNCGDLSLRLRIEELLAKTDRQLQHCRTQARILGQLNGKWNVTAGIPDTDPIEKLLACLDELVGFLEEMVLLL